MLNEKSKVEVISLQTTELVFVFSAAHGKSYIS